MTDPGTLAALAAEFGLQPDTVRLIMDAAEQHPGVVDPIALGRSWLRKRVEAERPSAQPQHAPPQRHSHRDFGEHADPEVAAREMAKINRIIGRNPEAQA